MNKQVPGASSGWEVTVAARVARHGAIVRRPGVVGEVICFASVVLGLTSVLWSCGDTPSASISDAATDGGNTTGVVASPVVVTSAVSTASRPGGSLLAVGPIEAVVADWPSYSPDRPLGWVLVDLAGTVIDGATRVVLQMRYDEIGCGRDGWPVSLDQLEPGTTLTFERGRAHTQTPAYGGEKLVWPAKLPVSAVRVRIACPRGTEEWAARLAAHRAIWDAAGIDTYGFTLRYTTMFLHGVYALSVIDGAPARAVRLEDDETEDYLNVAELPKTIDEIFDQLERELTGDSFAAQFDKDLGYPTHVCVDRLDNAVDDELEFYISDFVIDSPANPSNTRVGDDPQCGGTFGGP